MAEFLSLTNVMYPERNQGSPERHQCKHKLIFPIKDHFPEEMYKLLPKRQKPLMMSPVFLRKTFILVQLHHDQV
jgi:hypothetical protein